jgi:hypothetical protein
LNFVNVGDFLAGCIEVKVFEGHTLGMIAPLIHLDNGQKILYSADLYPSAAHIPANYVMSYDIQPLISMNERITMNELALNEQIIFFYEHDVTIEASLVGKNEKGQFHAVNPGKLANLIG